MKKDKNGFLFFFCGLIKHCCVPVRCFENAPAHGAPSLLYLFVNAVVHETVKVIRLLLIDY